MRDWFRKTSWCTADAEDFEARLARARSAKRAQYLRIQAVHLFDTGSKKLINVARALAMRVTSEYEDHALTGLAHLLVGQCHEALGDFPAALHEYRVAVNWERRMPSVHTDAYLDFAWLVARRGLVEQFTEAVKLLKRFKARPVFPIARYRYHASLAIIADERGDREIARVAAQAALLAAQERSSPFRFHRNLGLVKPTAGDMRKRLERLARPFGKPTARPRGRT